VTTNGGCTDTATVDIMVFNTTDVNDLSNDKNVVLYPNPANNHIFIMLDGNFVTSQNIEIYNYSGQLVKTVSASSVSGDALKISTADIVNGVYFFRLKVNDKYLTKKVTISR
jgi:hypothetical protein